SLINTCINNNFTYPLRLHAVSIITDRSSHSGLCDPFTGAATFYGGLQTNFFTGFFSLYPHLSFVILPSKISPVVIDLAH
ncbi:hypothetical protein HID58_087591, partial [Brassica napus]